MLKQGENMNQDMSEFVTKYRQTLESKASSIFDTIQVNRDDGKDTAEDQGFYNGLKAAISTLDKML